MSDILTKISLQASKIINKASDRCLKITTAESCTGGLISSALTAISGSSAVFEYGFITYSDSAKVSILNVKQDTLDRYGVYSKETAMEMANGALKISNAHLAIGITGIAGPSGDTLKTPVGTVYIAITNSLSIDPIVEEYHFEGSREEVRNQATLMALEVLSSYFY